MKKILVLAITLLVSNCAFSQKFDFQEQLNGFMLGQYRECGWNQYGKPIQSHKYDDGFEYEAFLLRPDTSLYMILEYSPQNNEVIWSIQIYGNDFDPRFKGLKLGMTEQEVLSILGREPDFSQDAGSYGKRIGYDSCNYSFEINEEGLLASIKLIDESYNYFTTNDLKELPSLHEIRKILTSEENELISEVLSPSMEVYSGDSTYFFQTPLDNEIKTDRSGIFELIKLNARDLLKIDLNDSSAYEANMRISQYQNPMHVMKFSKDYSIAELVFKYEFGRYLLWEVALRR